MTAKPTRAGSEVLVQLLGREMRGEAHVAAGEFSSRVVDKLAADGLVEFAVSLTAEGRRVAGECAHPEEGA